MRKPTPVITRHMTDDRGSRLKATSARKAPAESQGKSVTSMRGRAPMSSATEATVARNASSTVPQATAEIAGRGRRRPRTSRIRKPARGSAGTRATSVEAGSIVTSPLEPRRGVDVDGGLVAVEGDHEREAHGHLGGGH